MKIMIVLKILVAILTVATGFISLIAPQSVKGFTGLAADSPRAVSEIRAILGGLFIGLGAAVLYFRNPTAFVILGVTYLAIALVRLVSIFLDRAMVQSNWISLAIEIVCGIILVL